MAARLQVEGGGFHLHLTSIQKFGELRLELQCSHRIGMLLAFDAGLDNFI